MALPWLAVPKYLEVFAGCAAFVLAFVLCLEAAFNGGTSVEQATPLTAMIVGGCGAILVLSQLGVSFLHSGQRNLALRPVAWLVVTFTLVATAWSSHRYNSGLLRIEIGKASEVRAGELKEIRELVAVTDRGREVELYRWVDDGYNNQSAQSSQAGLDNNRANCHGWVFTGGEYLLSRDGVERILEDNGYQPCKSPKPGDLIVYRNGDGEILHSGLVKASLFGGILIESKWGVGGRFVHGPEMQPYGTCYSYYRSSRRGHTVAINNVGPLMKIASR
ncbi:MAG: hypothetical protein K8R36_09440 [Planctomycetales bacterium]|nr:hypothetical protein [Planctomycetales bacterium]